MPTTFFKQTSTAPNQYFKFEKESNNNNIKKNVTVPVKKNAGVHLAERTKTQEYIPNVFERLSRPTAAQLNRAVRRKDVSTDKAAKPLLRQNSQLNKRQTNTFSNKTQPLPLANLSVTPSAVKERVPLKKTLAQNKVKPARSISPKRREDSVSSHYLSPMKPLTEVNSGQTTKSVSFPISFKDNENSEYMKPLHKIMKMPSNTMNNKMLPSKINKITFSPPPLNSPEANVKSPEKAYLQKGSYIGIEKFKDPIKIKRDNESYPCPSPVSPVSPKKPNVSSERRARSPLRHSSIRNQTSRSGSSGRTKNPASSETISQGSCSFLSPSRDSLISSARVISSEESLDSNIITENVHDILARKDAEISASDVHVLKNVVKCDRRAAKLRSDDSIIFKDILKSQLKDIIKQEQIVVSALSSLDNGIPKNLLDSPNFRFRPVRHIEMDRYVEKVPLLEKEIVLLRTLGQRLELKLLQNELEKRSVTTSVTDLRERFQNCWPMAISMPKKDYVQYVTVSKGILCIYECIQEFYVVKKTLLELKQEADKHFYVPQHSELKVTTFEELKQKPSVLKRYLHPKHPEQAFNILDHDSIFFNDFFMKREYPQDEETNKPKEKITLLNPMLEPSHLNDGANAFSLSKKTSFTTNVYTVQTGDVGMFPDSLSSKQIRKESEPKAKEDDSKDFTSKQDTISYLLSSLNEQASKIEESTTDVEAELKSPIFTKSVEKKSIEKVQKEEETSSLPKNPKKEKRHRFSRQASSLPKVPDQVITKRKTINFGLIVTFQVTMLLIVFAALAFPDWTCK